MTEGAEHCMKYRGVLAGCALKVADIVNVCKGVVIVFDMFTVVTDVSLHYANGNNVFKVLLALQVVVTIVVFFCRFSQMGQTATLSRFD